MLIERSYEENIIVGDFKSVKVGLTLKSDKDLKTTEELIQASNKLLDLAKTIVRKDLSKIAEERQIDNKF